MAKINSNRQTSEEVINKFESVHGKQYGYDQVEYVNSKTKVKIKCRLHGVFEQTPVEHCRGKGCLKCGQIKKTGVEFEGKIYLSLNDIRIDHESKSSYTYFLQNIKGGMGIREAIDFIPTHECNGGEIYLVRNTINDMCYVGVTSIGHEQRLKKHIKDRTKKKKNEKSLAAAMVEHGVDKFYVEKLADANDSKELAHLENHYIKLLGTKYPNGYNLFLGGAIGTQSGTKTEIDEIKFKSRKMAAKYLSKKHGISEDAAIQRIRKGTPDKPPQTKLNMKIAREIREIRKTGATYKSIGDRYGLSKATIWRVIKEKAWKEKS